jgi:hypothetical protein
MLRSRSGNVSRIPCVCEWVVPAIEGADIPALLKEASCKGAGDMIADYGYVMNPSGARMIRRGRSFCKSVA